MWVGSWVAEVSHPAILLVWVGHRAEIIVVGLTTPLLFSNQALELSQVRVKMLISAYIETIS